MNHMKFKFYTREEVAEHNKRDDLWIIIHKSVLDITPLLQDRQDDWNENLDYFLKYGGKDVSDFFHDNGYPKLKICPYTHTTIPIFPPVVEEAKHPQLKNILLWCHDPIYYIGLVTRRSRNLRIVNTVNWQITMMTVCDEDTIADIQRKYYEKIGINDGGVFVWRKLSHKNKMPVEIRWNHTLDENGLIDLENPESGIPIPTLYQYPAQYIF